MPIFALQRFLEKSNTTADFNITIQMQKSMKLD